MKKSRIWFYQEIADDIYEYFQANPKFYEHDWCRYGYLQDFIKVRREHCEARHEIADLKQAMKLLFKQGKVRCESYYDESNGMIAGRGYFLNIN